MIELKNKLINKYASKELVESAKNEPITNDGGLGDMGCELQAKIDSGEIESLSNKELIDDYMAIVKLSGNQKLITMARVAVCKKTHKQLVDLVKFSAKTAISHSKK